jgi:hypothetical protein
MLRSGFVKIHEALPRRVADVGYRGSKAATIIVPWQSNRCKITGKEAELSPAPGDRWRIHT